MLDKKDKIIIDYLMHDCRISNTKLAKILKISRPAVVYRIQKLEEEGYITRYDGIPDFNKLGINSEVYFISVPENKKDDFIQEMKGNDGVQSLLVLIHKYNYCITTFANKNDINKINKYLKDQKLEHIHYKARSVEYPSFSIFDMNIKYDTPKYLNNKINLDESDIRILETLFHGSGRDSILDLSRKTNLPYDLVLYRFKKLKKSGYIPVLMAQPNLEKFHLNVVFLNFKTKNITKEEFTKQMKRINRALFMYELGDNEFLNVLVVRDIKDYNNLLDKYYQYLDGNIESLDVYPEKDWIFLNRVNMKKILE